MSVEIDGSVYFNKNIMEDIVNLRFSPGGCLATSKSAEEGISFLTCTPCTEGEMEETRRRDDTEIRSEGSWDIEKFLVLSVTNPRAPPIDLS